MRLNGGFISEATLKKMQDYTVNKQNKIVES